MQPRLNATWGGGAIMDPATGKFHLYVSDMAGGGYLRGEYPFVLLRQNLGYAEIAF